MEITVLLLLANSASSSWPGANETLPCLVCGWWREQCHRSTCLPRHSTAMSRAEDPSTGECAPIHVPAAPVAGGVPPESMPDHELRARVPALAQKRQNESAGATTQIGDCDNGRAPDRLRSAPTR